MTLLQMLTTGLALAAIPSVARATEIKSISAITADDIGEFVTVTGKSAGFFHPEEPRAPYAFNIQETSGTMIRVTAWPDIFDRVDNREDLKTTGTPVRLTAEVAEYKEKLELHLQDWEEIDIMPLPQLGSAADTGTTPTAAEGSSSTTSTHHTPTAIIEQ